MTRFAAASVLAFTMALVCSPPGSAQEPDLADSFLGVREVTCESTGNADALFFIPPLANGSRSSTLGLPGEPSEVWIDLSLFDNGFASGTFLGFGPLHASSDHQAIRWVNLRSAVHYYRINAKVGDTWHVITGGVFQTPDCYWVTRIVCDEQSRTNVTFIVRDPGITEHAAPLETWLDLTLRSDGYRPGTFIGSGPFDVNAPTQFVWQDLHVMTRHYWRTNTLFVFFDNQPRWVTQVGGSFLTHDCNNLNRVAN